MHDTYPVSCPQHSTGSRWHQSCTFLILTLASLTLVTLIIIQDASASERSSNHDAPAQMGTLILTDSATRIDAVQLDAHMTVSISGLLAQMTLTQTFQNPGKQWMQARYLFPLPELAAVQNLLIKTDGRTIHGKIMQRNEARETFETARDNGQITGLVEQQRPNLFTMDVATVAPGSELSVELTIMLPVHVDRHHRSLTLPTTHTPRYTNEKTPDPARVSGAFTTKAQQHGPRLTMSAMIDGLADHTLVTSDTHLLSGDKTRVVLDSIPMDRDLVIQWPADYSDTAASQLFISEHDNERYAQIVLNPPARTAIHDTVSRELILVIDKSGSMAGESITAARKALQFALDSMTPEDSFNIVAFDDKSYPLFDRSVSANDTNLNKAQRFIKQLDAEGGTEMRESLQFALRANTDPDDTRLRQVVFLTDGSVGYEEALLMDIERTLGDSRLFTVGIGSAPNQWFLEKAALVGRGVFLTIPDSHEAADAIQQLLTNLIRPVITDIDVQFIGGRGEIHPNPIADLYADKPQMMVGKLNPEVTMLIITGQQAMNDESVRWQQRLDIQTAAVVSTSSAVPSAKLLWTRLKVASLLDEQRYSADPLVNKQQIIQLALNAQLVTPYTSFVAVEQQITRASDESLHASEVASLVPHGNTMMTLAMPQGAAGIDTLGWLSALLGLLGTVLMVLWKLTVTRVAGQTRQTA